MKDHTIVLRKRASHLKVTYEGLAKQNKVRTSPAAIFLELVAFAVEESALGQVRYPRLAFVYGNFFTTKGVQNPEFHSNLRNLAADE